MVPFRVNVRVTVHQPLEMSADQDIVQAPPRRRPPPQRCSAERIGKPLLAVLCGSGDVPSRSTTELDECRAKSHLESRSTNPVLLGACILFWRLVHSHEDVPARRKFVRFREAEAYLDYEVLDVAALQTACELDAGLNLWSVQA